MTNCLALPAAALALCACASDLSSPFSAVAVAWDVNQQSFRLAQVRSATLTSLRHLEGSSGTVTAGGKVRVVNAAIRGSSASVESLRAAFIEEPPDRVEVAWNVVGDIAYPEDFASLELFSTYSSVEKARKALADWGLSALPARPIVVHADLQDEHGLSPLAAGELYYPPLATFYAPAPTAQQGMPPAFNLGAVAHAVAHEAVQELVWSGAPAAAPELGADEPARHLARSMAEGLSDYLAAAVSGDPRWFDHSLVQDSEARALDRIRCGTPAMLDALAVSDAQAPYDPYPLGSVISGALWEQASAGSAQDLSQAVLASLPDLGAKAAAGALGLGQILDVLAARAPGDQRSSLCGLFLNRFARLGIGAADLPSCGTASLRKECQ